MAEIKSINELLSMNLNIPDYQRPYKWDIQNIDDLFLDITNAISDADRYRTEFKYRIGTIILRNQIISQCKTARKIIKVEEIRVVDKIQLPTGKQQLLDSSEIHENTIKRYRPASNTDGCFCQMCRVVKSTEYIEVNNIWSKPEYYWPQMRVALCLDCSKKFKSMRRNRDIIGQFYSNIKTANIQSGEAISVPIGNADIRFTQTHLAEIQEILKSDKKLRRSNIVSNCDRIREIYKLNKRFCGKTFKISRL